MRIAGGLVLALAAASCTAGGNAYTASFPQDFPLQVAAPIGTDANTWYEVTGVVPGSSYALNISVQKTTTPASAIAYTNHSADSGDGQLCAASIQSGNNTATCLFQAPDSGIVFIGVVGASDVITMNISTQ